MKKLSVCNYNLAQQALLGCCCCRCCSFVRNPRFTLLRVEPGEWCVFMRITVFILFTITTLLNRTTGLFLACDMARPLWNKDLVGYSGGGGEISSIIICGIAMFCLKKEREKDSEEKGKMNNVCLEKYSCESVGWSFHLQ